MGELNKKGVEAAIDAVFHFADGEADQIAEGVLRAYFDAVPSPQDHVVPCPCTLIEQDEDCPIGYPSMICGVCKGTGNTTPEQVTALACEMIKIASDMGEPEDPFAAWESIELLKSQTHASVSNKPLLTCQCANTITDPCIVCGKGKTLVTAEWLQKMAAREGDLDCTTGSPASQSNLRASILEEAARIADEHAAADMHLRDKAKESKDATGVFVHAAEAATGRSIAAAIRSLSATPSPEPRERGSTE